MSLAMERAGTVHWNNARGLVEVTFLSLRRAGWLVVSPTAWRTPRGQNVELDDVAPAELRQLLEADFLDYLWKGTAQRRESYRDLTALR